jgi:malonyl CoA-acyl carrier protein transacylase
MEPIAIIGIGCRFPGANNPEAFWQILRDGVDAITEVPPDRWDINSFYDPEPAKLGKMNTRWGGFLEQVDHFEPSFFGISSREAERMDPQQRLVLEVAWEALENAGLVPEKLACSQTGVFIGISTCDYNRLLYKDLSRVDAYGGTGTSIGIAANRLSYTLNLRGPSVAIDTACSSSLVAVHFACQSLQNGESHLALAGGVNLILSPDGAVTFSQARMMASDGRCKTFDASADGYVRSEGCGVVVLKRLKDALRDRDNILAIIKGSAVNQDGLSNGITAPNGLSQQVVIRQALENAGVASAQISYVEAHGTGTSLGDPIEVKSLKTVLMQDREPDQPCWISSVKTNIGHLEAAAGIASLIKVVLSLQHGEILPHLHLKQLNPYISLEGTPFSIPTQLQPWSSVEQLRLAGISAFGFGGTNAHVILEEAPIQESQVKDSYLDQRPCHILTLSAKCEKALQELGQRYGEFLGNNSTASIADICFTAHTGRSHFNHRLAIITSDKQELADQLVKISAGEKVNGVFSGKLHSNRSPKIAFLFTGQGSQYINMGRQLYETQPVFRQTLDQCEQILQSYLEKSLLDVIYPENTKEINNSVIDQTAYTQPALFAIEYALAQLWQSWGIKPDVVMGHSVGEYVAATVAGVFSLEDGLKLVAHRGRLMQQLPSGGEMVAVMASFERVNQVIAPYTEKVAIAAINGPVSVVISGAAEAIGMVRDSLEAEVIKTKQLQVSHAFHSPLMEPMLADFEAVANQITYHQPRIPLISNVTGARADERIATTSYWVNHVSQPVKFAQSMETLHQEGYEVFLEIGPKPILLGMARQCLPVDVGVWLPSLCPITKQAPELIGSHNPKSNDWQQMLQSFGELYVQGVKVDWSGFDRDYPRSKVVLPTYPFQRQRYWIETNSDFQKKRYLFAGKDIHPLLGRKLNCAGEQETFESFLGEESPAYLSKHRVFDEALFPTTAYLEMAAAAGKYRWRTGSVVVENLSIRQGLILPPGELINVQTVLTPSDNKTYQLQIFSQQEQQNQEEEKWVLHVTGKIRPEETSETQTKIDLKKYQSECSQPIDIKQHYQQCSQIGINYGSSFQGLEKLWSGSNQALAQIKLPEELIAETRGYQFHPALLDAALQVTFHALPETNSDKTYLPVGVEEFKIYGRPGLSFWAHTSVTQPTVENPENLNIQVTLVSPEGEIIATIKGLQFKLATKKTLLTTETESITDWLYEVEWRTKGLLGRLPAPDFLLKPIEIEQKLAPSLTELVTQIDGNSTSEIARSLDELSVDYIVQGLLSMGWPYKLGETFNSDAAAQRLGIVPSQRRLFTRLLQILAEVGILESNQQQWQVQQTLKKVNPTEKSQSLLQQAPEEAATLTLLDRCASKLSGVLRGAIDPVQLVFPQGNLTTATQLYQDSSVAKVMNTIVQKAISTATEKLPPSRGLRLLEIGAGTGGTTSYVLPHLNPHQAEYLFTDIGALFTGKAQEKFRDYNFLQYKTLDIEVDPDPQGFDSHQYDIIIAANVLHATTSIKQTLSYVRQMLAPGGMLVLLEATTRTRYVDLIFGLLEGWWKFQDHELRPDYPLLSRCQWKNLLNETGLTQVVILPEVEGMPEILSQQAVIVASAPQISESTASIPKGWLLFADSKGVAQQLARQLNSQGDICTLVFAGEKYQQIAPGEFTINPHNPSEYERLMETVAAQSSSLHGVVQCWSTEAEVGKTINFEELKNLSKLGCGATLSLVQALVKGGLSQPPRLWLVTSGSQPVPSNDPVLPGVTQSSLWGMGKVISLEHPELNCVRIDLDPQETIEGQALALFQEIWSEDREDQVAWRGDSRYVARLVASRHRQEKQQKLIPSQPFKLGISQKGSLDSLILEPVKRRSPEAGEVEIRVKATGLNLRDVLIALDIYPGEPIMGGDCAGEIMAVGAGVTRLSVGDSVIAMTPGSFSNYVTVDAHYVALKPENFSFEEAASIPVNFLTAYYALHHLAKITAEDRVLIHAAAGGTGMAAVQIAQAAGAEVFATASPSKWEALRKMGVKHIMNSRTLEFADQVMSLTEGKGVDIVLNSLTSGEFINKSVDALSAQGRFVELAVRNIWDYEQIRENKPDIVYFPVDLSQTSQEQPELINSMLLQLIDNLSNGLLQPPPLQVFPRSEVINAFRYMQKAKHIGKIVVNQTTQQADANTKKSVSFREDATYLITGGMGGLGLLVARWMVSKGAKHLVLVGRRSPDEAARKKLMELEMAGAAVVVEKADVSDVTAITRVLYNIENSKAPLAGIIHSAGMLSDGALSNQTWSSFEKVMAPKVQGAWYLHQLTQNQPLDFFVLFSSAASLLGSPGQGNHSAANGFLDGLAHYRRAIGLPGLSLHWGAVSQVGEAAERGADVRAHKQGMGVISPTQVLESLELLMSGTAVEVGVVPIQWSAWQERVAQWPFLSDWQEIIQTTSEGSGSEFLLKLEAAAPGERHSLLVAHVRRQLSLVLGINNPESISLETGFFDLGMDSLTSVELRNKLQTSLGCSVPSTLVFDYPTLGQLVDYLAHDLLIEKKPILDDETVVEVEEIAQKLAEQLGIN